MAQAVPGKKVGGHVYVHRDAVPFLPEASQEAVGKASSLAVAFAWNVAKVPARGDGPVSLLKYEDFGEAAFPALLASARADPETGEVGITDYSLRENPPILHRKELLLPPDDPRIPSFKAVTARAEAAGLFAEPSKIGTKKAWQALLEKAGLAVDGPRLVAAGQRVVEVARGKTALSRNGLSQPLSVMLRLGMLPLEDELFDYGCGRGDDVAILQSNGYRAFGWDPEHRPEGERREADVVNLGFVLNVIEDPYERAETLRTAWSYARKALAVSVMTLGKGDVSGLSPHGDGFLTGWGTFQRYFSQDEISALVGRTLGERPVTLVPGIVAAFRDKDLEQEVLYRKRSKASFISRSIEIPYREPRQRPAAAPLREKIREELEAIWRTALELGRMPAPSEIDGFIVASLDAKHVSVRRALASVGEGMFDPAQIASAAEARREDLLVHAALSIFPGAPAYRSLPEGLQRDVKAFFGSHAWLLAEARTALSVLAREEAVAEACAAAAKEGIASFDGEVLRASMKDYGRLPAALRIVIGCADVVHDGFLATDFVRVGPGRGQVKGYRCDRPESVMPRVTETVDVDLGRSQSRARAHEEKVLYLKSRFMPADDPSLARQREAEERLVASGVVTPDGRGPSASKLASFLAASAKRPR